MAPATASSRPGTTASGAAVVLALLLGGVALAAFAVWFQWRQTRRCLRFYGPVAADRIQAGPRVELWELTPGATGPVVARRQDVSRAPGLVHLRRGLVEDANFRWHAAQPPRRLPAAAWDVALAFHAAAPAAEPTVLAIDFDAAGGSVTVVGRPGRVGLGRIEAGLRTWVEKTRAAGSR